MTLAERGTTGVFNATGPERPLTMQGFLDEARAAIGSDARFTWVDEAFLLEAGVEPWMEMPLWVPESWEAMRFFLTMDCGRAFAAGLTCRPVAATVRDTLAWTRSAEMSDRDRRVPETPGAQGAAPPRAEPDPGLSPEKERDLLARWRTAR